MLKRVKSRWLLLDWLPAGDGLTGLLTLGWWLVLSGPLRRSLRPALGGAAGRPTPGPANKPRRARRSHAGRPRPAYPAAAG